MARLLVFVFALSATGCLVDPTLYPYRPLDSDSGVEDGLDAGSGVDASEQTTLRDDAGEVDTGAVDSGVVDSGAPDTSTPDMGPPDMGREYDSCRGKCECNGSCALDCDDKKCEPICKEGATCSFASLGKKSKVECKDDGTVCEPIVCLDECDVDCNTSGGSCVVFCEGDKKCALTCKPEARECRIEGCEDLVQCDDGWVCNGRC